jgi:excinuclease UvrABC nuclease subunit
MLNLPSGKLGSLHKFLREHRDVAMRYLVSQIQKGIKDKKQRINLFQLGDTKIVAAVKSQDYLKILREAMDFFIQNELYEDATKCRDLINQIESVQNKKIVERFLKEMDSDQKG